MATYEYLMLLCLENGLHSVGVVITIMSFSNK